LDFFVFSPNLFFYFGRENVNLGNNPKMGYDKIYEGFNCKKINFLKSI